MEQHAIPQNVSSYQFKLVGDMTLKQFFQLAGGFLVALIFYSAPLIGVVKWPFVIVSAILGVALAFLPLEERPLERWIFAFFKAIYAPTEYFWKRSPTLPKFFQDEPPSAAAAETASPQEKAMQEYLSSASQKTGPLAKLEGAEQGFLTTLTGIFTGVVSQVSTGVTKPQPAGELKTPPERQELQIPAVTPIKIVSNIPHLIVEERRQEPLTSVPQITTQQVAPTMGEEIVSTTQALFSIDAAPPNPPTTPNVVVGQVVDAGRKIIEGAIMEIRDSGGRPVRALRSNKAGHFITITPLEVGKYDIITEKDGFEFTPVTFEATGDLIPPILVQGRKVVTEPPVPTEPVYNTSPATIQIN